MFVRGTGVGAEARRVDNSFYMGIVVKNNDPLKVNRVKVYVPELSNQPYDEWFEKFDALDIKFPGQNNTGDAWVDTKIFEEIASLIPWASPCFPIVGESGAGRYFKSGEIATVSDCNYSEGFQVNDTESLSLSAGAFSPAFLYENHSTALGDAFTSPTSNFTGKCNPYSFLYKPSKHVNKAKGLFGIPEVGSKVWIFHHMGDLNFPHYFGTYQDFRSLTLINNTDNDEKISPTYPSDFEN